jgi:restriction system protein
MAIPTFNLSKIPFGRDFMLIVMQQMVDGSYKRTEMYHALKDAIKFKWKLTDEEMNSIISTGRNRIEDRIGWAMTFLTKAEYIEKDENRKMSYIITELGKKALDDCTQNNTPLNVKYLEEHSPNYTSNWNVKSVVSTQDVTIIEEKNDVDIEVVAGEMRDAVEEELKAKLQAMEWQQFEDFCGELVVKMGYGVQGTRGRRVKDGGIDGTILAGDKLNIKEKIYIQAKRYQASNTVSSKDMQAFLYVVTKLKAKGIFITTSTFSPDAKSVANDDEKTGHIAIIDINRLIKLCFEYRHGVAVTRTVDLFEVIL